MFYNKVLWSVEVLKCLSNRLLTEESPKKKSIFQWSNRFFRWQNTLCLLFINIDFIRLSCLFVFFLCNNFPCNNSIKITVNSVIYNNLSYDSKGFEPFFLQYKVLWVVISVQFLIPNFRFRLINKVVFKENNFCCVFFQCELWLISPIAKVFEQ